MDTNTSSPSRSVSFNAFSLTSSLLALLISLLSICLVVFVNIQCFSRRARSRDVRDGLDEKEPDVKKKGIVFSRNVLFLSTAVTSLMGVLRQCAPQQFTAHIQPYFNETCAFLPELEAASVIIFQWAWALWFLQAAIVVIPVLLERNFSDQARSTKCLLFCSLFPVFLGITHFLVYASQCPGTIYRWCLCETYLTLFAYIAILLSVILLIISSVKQTLKLRENDKRLKEAATLGGDMQYEKTKYKLCQRGIIFYLIVLALLTCIFIPRAVKCMCKHLDVHFKAMLHLIYLSDVCFVLAPLGLLLNEVFVFLSKYYSDELKGVLVKPRVRKGHTERKPDTHAFEMQNLNSPTDDNID